MSTCGAPAQGGDVVVAPVATVVDGVVVREGEPVPGAYVRLHDADGEFTAEVVTGPGGEFVFYARPARWELRVLTRTGSTSQHVEAAVGRTSVRLAV